MLLSIVHSSWGFEADNFNFNVWICLYFLAVAAEYCFQQVTTFEIYVNDKCIRDDGQY